MKTFKELEYRRPDVEAIKQGIQEFVEAFPKVKTYEEAKSLYMVYEKSSVELSTMYEIASIRNSVDTTDAFYDGEMNFFYEVLPELELQEKEAARVILESPWREDFGREFGEDFIRGMEAQQKLSDASIIEEQIEESQVTQEYSKVTAQATTVFRGESCNFYGLLKHMESTDREERKEAFLAWSDLYKQIAPELDRQYDRLIELRVSMAKKLGFSSYTEMAYLQNGHYYYTPKDVEAFHKQVLEVVVPAVKELYERQRAHIGVDKLHYYDEQLVWPEGNATPIGSTEELVEKARTMYEELSPETGEFFNFMCEHQLFDLETKPGKQMGGYCTFINGEKAPFIFSNFNGTSADVDVLTHEAGHAFQAYTSSRCLPLSSQIWSTSEISEIHSMTMEHLTYPYMKRFFGDATEKYLYAHLSAALKVVPYLCLVDAFQHAVYKNPEMTAMERRATWRDLEKQYMPWRDYDGNEFLEMGGFWMQKQHIFLYPFYYVDYALAQMGAFELYTRCEENLARGWADYYTLCKLGGSRPYFETLKAANISNPFEEGSVRACVAPIIEKLKKAKY